MKLFRTIQEFLTWKRDCATSNPYEITGEEADELITLSFGKDWDFYTKLLDNAIYIEAENLLTIQPELVEKQRGMILGLRKAGTILSQIADEKEHRDARRRDTEREHESTELTRRTNAFASPFWTGSA